MLSAGSEGSPQAAAAMEELCRKYWFPLYSFIRRKGYEWQEAQDLTQEFFARLLQHNWLSRADRQKGRFRSFLLGALNHFLANEWRRNSAAKRGGGRPVISLDDTAETRYRVEPVSNLSPERLYERRWALNLFERALGLLRMKYAAAGKERLYEELKQFLSDDSAEGDYRRVGEKLGLSSGAVATAVHRLRQQYRELVRQEVAQTVADPAEIETELRALLEALSG